PYDGRVGRVERAADADRALDLLRSERNPRVAAALEAILVDQAIVAHGFESLDRDFVGGVLQFGQLVIERQARGLEVAFRPGAWVLACPAFHRTPDALVVDLVRPGATILHQTEPLQLRAEREETERIKVANAKGILDAHVERHDSPPLQRSGARPDPIGLRLEDCVGGLRRAGMEAEVSRSPLKRVELGGRTMVYDQRAPMLVDDLAVAEPAAELGRLCDVLGVDSASLTNARPVLRRDFHAENRRRRPARLVRQLPLPCALARRPAEAAGL